MRISRVKLNNYVCFYDQDAEWVELGPGINFVVGKNNSGKTAFLDALNLDDTRASHRSIETIPYSNVQSNEPMRVAFEIAFEPGELLRITRQFGSTHWIPSEHARQYLKLSIQEVARRALYNESRFQFTAFPVAFSIDRAFTNFDVTRLPGEYGSFGSWSWMLLGESDLLSMENFDMDAFDRNTPSILNIWIEQCLSNIYKFNAQRIAAPHTATTNELRLNPDGSNLAQVLDTASRFKTHKYTKLIQLVKAVFESLEEVLTLKLSDEENKEYLEVYIGYYPTELQREDLRIPLSACGTGLAQIIAILYVVVMSEHSRIILIDEPQSFLHPDALRNLLAIFQLPDYSHHQYIMATHSPAAIASVRDKHIVLLNREGMKSTVSHIDHGKSADIEAVLRAVGARLSDVFGMDSIIWVEGETDEICFPMIMRAHGLPLIATKILRVAHTGDFTDKKHGETAVKLYKRLSEGGGLLPPALAFIFDADMEKKLHGIRAEIGKSVKLLPRQNYESYLIAPEILADILNSYSADGYDKNQTADTIKAWIRANYERDYDDEEWLKSVDGAKLLDCMFNKLAGISYENNKVAYGEAITRRILERDDSADHFKEIVDILAPLLDTAQN